MELSDRDLVNSAQLQTRPGPFSGEFGSHAWRIRPTPLENSACRLVNSDYLSFIIKLLINIYINLLYTFCIICLTLQVNNIS